MYILIFTSHFILTITLSDRQPLATEEVVQRDRMMSAWSQNWSEAGRRMESRDSYTHFSLALTVQQQVIKADVL